jgi:tetratricopeptide (TPR) repeat protein
MTPAALALVVAAAAVAAPGAAAGGAASAPAYVLERRVEHAGCGREVAAFTHRALPLSADGEDLVDVDARPWELGAPALYTRAGDAFEGHERHRLGDGAVRVEVRLEPAAGRFTARLLPEPAGDFEAAKRAWLPGIPLPCRTDGTLVVRPAGRDEARLPDPPSVLRTYRLEHAATELLYDLRFEEARAALGEAASLSPRDPTPRWMAARAHYLEGESLPPEDRTGRLEAFHRAERAADQAVAVDPESAEGWLWRAVSRGRIATTQGDLRTAFQAVGRSRGPRWVADCFERAIQLKPQWRQFGHSALADALYGAAQLYRLLPDGPLVGLAIGVDRDLDRAVALLRRARAIQPDRLEYAKELGVALLCRGAERDREEDLRAGRAALEESLALPAPTTFDRTDRRHAAELLASPPEAACGYSRDLWGATHVAGEAS